MDRPDATFTLAYVVFALCFVFTPNEFRSAGFTVQHIFSQWLGSEDIGFIQHHLRRSTLTALLHCCLPLGYYIGMCVAAPEQDLLQVHRAAQGWQLYLGFSLAVLLVSCVLVFCWSRRGWENHPICRVLSAHALPRSSWRAVAASINTEFRRIDKFASGCPSARVIVTDSWVMKVSTYSLHIALQQDCHLTVTDCTQHSLSPELNAPVQILTIRVSSINPRVQPFTIRLKSSEYAELQEKLQAPIRNAANVVIHLSMSELFLETFKTYVKMNAVYECPSGQELEPCIGCMQASAGVKLLRLCDGEGECQQCYCRPMWCLTCMGKWFASRQDQQQPETWLSSRVPCPTCRAKFCILDVCSVE
ncbi:E3 ubiquitin-protein ligase TM129 [Sinocyclocheilus anshuiensis]|uniref:RING-type domain-containing protein n=1 Tax=Sinocyclocheilus anshuiensis TaxID=1608454 RepID=A0A671RFX8_9TELE|nr:PREDICTED: E3 ubiquitin-protein ligase TM129 [Sinocyclocheilus anshuiensis]XP_016341781.1 PREDICTED: E3 ubiquitin-protein ligase TM129 [Sinocyclocheilus anshuiensis]